MESKFKIVLAVPEYLKDCINVMAELTTEVDFEVTKDGLYTAFMDPANVAMAVYKLEPAACVEYAIEEPFKFAINIAQFDNILKKCKKDEILVLQDNGNKIEIQFRSDITKTYKIPILESESKEQKVPSIDFKEILTLDSKTFKELVAAHKEIADRIKFIGDKEVFVTESKNDLLEELTIPIKGETVHIANSEGLSCKYSVEYLEKIAKASKCSNRVVIEFGKDWPLRLTYTQNDKFKLTFFLAPMVED
jgi:proliferating cell nuclear antigen PCNA